MAINDVAGEKVYYVRDILPKFMGHNFVSGLRILKHKKTLKLSYPVLKEINLGQKWLLTLSYLLGLFVIGSDI